ncbi:MAG TPA: hypothetical protein VJ932_09705, partial [Alkalispirochaeta sp.]|nr:hypothetical protein [Alkalispirochaeta sp.]
MSVVSITTPSPTKPARTRPRSVRNPIRVGNTPLAIMFTMGIMNETAIPRVSGGPISAIALT